MADQLTIARPYARAGFDFASAAGTLEDWSHWLSFSAALVDQPAVRAFITNPTIGAKRRSELFCSLLEGNDETKQGNSEFYRNFISLLAQNNRLSTLPAIQAIFERLKFERQHVQPVEIISPYPLSDSQIHKISGSIKKRFNKEVAITVKIEPKLIGGIVVRAGDVVIDGSLSGRLAKLQNTLKS